MAFTSVKRIAGFLLAICTWQVVYAAPPEHSISPSRQFIIYGGNPALRGVISGLAEQTKSNLLSLLRQRDNWKALILINLQPPQPNIPEAPAADLRFTETELGLRLQLDLSVSRDPDASLIERELLRTVLLEMIYRKASHVTAGSAFVEPPAWLIDGVLALAPGRERGDLIQAVVAADKSLPLEKFLRQRPELLDSAGRMLYRAYSFALVQMLIETDNGADRLGQYIAHLSRGSNDPLVDLKAHFPLLRDDAEKSWDLKLSQFGQLQRFQLLTFAESKRRLDELLRVNISEAKKPAKLASLGELAQRKISPNEKMALNQASRDLLLFVAQANPVLRPIVREYQQMVALLARGKRRGVAKRLSRLELTRQQLAARMSDIDDYMNWFEATQMKSGSGNFTSYVKALDQSQLTAPKRRDPLSIYLDSVSDAFEQ
jgi:hypothetical protein